jgi:hypothetical protein
MQPANALLPSIASSRPASLTVSIQRPTCGTSLPSSQITRSTASPSCSPGTSATSSPTTKQQLPQLDHGALGARLLCSTLYRCSTPWDPTLIPGKHRPFEPVSLHAVYGHGGAVGKVGISILELLSLEVRAGMRSLISPEMNPARASSNLWLLLIERFVHDAHGQFRRRRTGVKETHEALVPDIVH